MHLNKKYRNRSDKFLNKKRKIIRVETSFLCIADVTVQYLMVAHVPVGPFSESHHLPHDYPEAPNIAGRGELPISDGLRSSPADWNFPSLRKNPQAPLRWSVFVFEQHPRSNNDCITVAFERRMRCSGTNRVNKTGHEISWVNLH